MPIDHAHPSRHERHRNECVWSVSWHETVDHEPEADVLDCSHLQVALIHAPKHTRRGRGSRRPLSGIDQSATAKIRTRDRTLSHFTMRKHFSSFCGCRARSPPSSHKTDCCLSCRLCAFVAPGQHASLSRLRPASRVTSQAWLPPSSASMNDSIRSCLPRY